MFNERKDVIVKIAFFAQERFRKRMDAISTDTLMPMVSVSQFTVGDWWLQIVFQLKNIMHL